MEIYNYHPEHKVYLGSSTADPSPLEPGVFLIPAYATTVKPPECSSSKIQVFNETSWDIIDNCSGTYYNKTTGEIIEHDNPINPPENATKEQPPEVPSGYILEWNDGWTLNEIQAPPELTAEEKLANAGLTVEDLKKLLGL